MKLLFVIIVLLVVQTQCRRYGAIPDDDGGDNSAIGFPRVLWSFISAFVDVVTDYGITKLNDLTHNMGKIERELSAKEVKIVDDLWEFIVGVLNDIEDDGILLDKAGAQCIKENGDDVKKMMYNFTSLTTTCQVERGIMVLGTLVPILIDIQNTNNDIIEIIAEVRKCGTGEQSYDCIKELTDKMEKDLTELGSTLLEDLSDAAKSIDYFGKAATMCQNDATDILGTVAGNITDAIDECMKNKEKQ